MTQQLVLDMMALPAQERFSLARLLLDSVLVSDVDAETLIAARALADELVLVTNSRTEFARVPNLKLEDWTQ